MADSGITRHIANGIRFALTKASTTHVSLLGPVGNPATNIAFRLPSALPVSTQAVVVTSAGQIQLQNPVNSVFGRNGAVGASVNDYSASLIAGFGGNAGVVAMTPSSAQTLTPATSILPNAGVVLINPSSVIAITTSNPQINAGVNGQVLTLVNTASNSITFGNGRGLNLGTSTVTLLNGQTISLVYSTLFTSWLVRAVGSSIANSPNFAGQPTAATAPLGTNTTQLATTAFVQQSRRPLVIVSRTLTLNVTATYADFAFNNVIRNSSTSYNPSTGVFTAPYTGFYAFSAMASEFTGLANWLLVGLGSANVEQERVSLQYGPSGWHICTGRVVVYLTAGQTRSYGIQANVALTSLVEQNSTSRLSCHASIEYLGNDA